MAQVASRNSMSSVSHLNFFFFTEKFNVGHLTALAGVACSGVTGVLHPLNAPLSSQLQRGSCLSTALPGHSRHLEPPAVLLRDWIFVPPAVTTWPGQASQSALREREFSNDGRKNLRDKVRRQQHDSRNRQHPIAPRPARHADGPPRSSSFPPSSSARHPPHTPPWPCRAGTQRSAAPASSARAPPPPPRSAPPAPSSSNNAPPGGTTRPRPSPPAPRSPPLSTRSAN